MPYKTFLMFYDYMLWQLRDQTEEGRKENDKIERVDLGRSFGWQALRYHDSVNVGDAMRSIKSIKKP